MSSNKLKCVTSNNVRKCSKNLKKINIELVKKIPKLNNKSESDLINYRICSSCYIYHTKQDSSEELKTSVQQEFFTLPTMVSPKPSTSALPSSISSAERESSTSESANRRQKMKKR